VASGRSWDPSGEVDGALHEAIEHFGPRVLSNPRVLENLLSDLLPDETAETRLLVFAAEHDLAGSVVQLCQQVDADEAVRLAAGRFAEHYPIDAEAAVWAASTVAGALGHPASTAPDLPIADRHPPRPPADDRPTTPDGGPPGFAMRPTIDAGPAVPARAPEVPGWGRVPSGWGPAAPTPQPAPPARRWPKVVGVLAGVAVLAALGAGGGLLLLDRKRSPGVNATTPSSTTAPATTAPPTTAPTTTPTTVAPTTTVPAAMPVAAVATSPDPRLAEATLGRYFAALDAADWQAAWATFSPAQQARVSPADIAQGATGTNDSAIMIEVLTANPDGSEVATVSFRSTQPPANSPNASACDDWNLDYSLVQGGPGLLIDRVTPVTNLPYSTC
jgi:hypothetical protein